MPPLPDTLPIDVIQDDIDRGHRADGIRCAVAQALHRKGYDEVEVIPYANLTPEIWISLPQEDGSYEHARFTFPQDVAEKLRDWDAGQPLEPLAFDATRTIRPQ